MSAADAPDLRIVIPAHNEQARIEPTLTQYCSEFAGRATIVVVANGCADKTTDVVRGLQQRFDNLALVDVPNAIGKGGAVRVGLSTGSEDYVGFVDADGSTSAVEFGRLFDALVRTGADAVVASRWMPGSRVEPKQGLTRRLASRIFNGLVRVVLGLRMRDTQCGAKLFRREAVREVLDRLEVADFAFDIEMLWRLKRAGRQIVEVPTVWADRAAGTKVALLRASWAMFKTLVRIRLRESALWYVPFVDFVGRKSTIPNVTGRRMLLLGTLAAQAHEPELERFFALLRQAGVDLADTSEAGGSAKTPWRFLFWYAFASRRAYDAVIEVVDSRLWILPWLSMKPTFVVATGARRYSEKHRHWYGRSTFVDLAVQEPDSAAAVVMSAAYFAAEYPAVFRTGTSELTLHYPDRETGAPTTHVLR